jgi:hypothetical protein
VRETRKRDRQTPQPKRKKKRHVGQDKRGKKRKKRGEKEGESVKVEVNNEETNKKANTAWGKKEINGTRDRTERGRNKCTGGRDGKGE